MNYLNEIIYYTCIILESSPCTILGDQIATSKTYLLNFFRLPFSVSVFLFSPFFYCLIQNNPIPVTDKNLRDNSM